MMYVRKEVFGLRFMFRLQHRTEPIAPPRGLFHKQFNT